MIRCTLLSMLGSLMFCGCAGLRELPHITTNELARNISDNAANINEAQSRATSAIIVKNILRARDRWPTSYSTLSGVTSNPQIVFGTEATFTPLGLGNPPNPFGGSNAKLSQDNTASASYEVNPFYEQNGGENIFKPITRELFKEYWDAGYPKDVLIMLFVESVEQNGCTYPNDIDVYVKQRKADTETSEAAVECENKDSGAQKEFRAVIAPLLKEKCEKFLRANALPEECVNKKSYALKQTITHDLSKCPVIHKFYSSDLFASNDKQEKTVLDRIKMLSDLKDGDVHLDIVEVCETIGQASELYLRGCKSTEKKEQYKFVYSSGGVQEEKPAQEQCESRRREALELFEGVPKVLNEASEDNHIEFKLRSIDSMVYFLGEYLRMTTGEGDEKKPPFYVLNGAEHGGGKCSSANSCLLKAAIFDAASKDFWRYRLKDLDDSFAVSVLHAGERYYAAPKVACNASTGSDREADCVSDIDRTGTVLSVLAQLFIRSQSKEFLKAPDSNVLRTQ